MNEAERLALSDQIHAEWNQILSTMVDHWVKTLEKNYDGDNAAASGRLLNSISDMPADLAQILVALAVHRLALAKLPGSGQR